MKNLSVRFLFIIAVLITSCARKEAKTTQAACEEHLRTIYHALTVASMNDGWGGMGFPPSFNGLSGYITNAQIFRCPSRGSQTGPLAKVAEWSDYVYLTNIVVHLPFPIAQTNKPIVLCMGPHHDNRVGVLYWDGRIEFIKRNDAERMVTECIESIRSGSPTIK